MIMLQLALPTACCVQAPVSPATIILKTHNQFVEALIRVRSRQCTRDPMCESLALNEFLKEHIETKQRTDDHHVKVTFLAWTLFN